jgi:hypothetical protein
MRLSCSKYPFSTLLHQQPPPPPPVGPIIIIIIIIIIHSPAFTASIQHQQCCPSHLTPCSPCHPTGNTAAAMGLADLSSRGATPQLMAPVPKEKLLADVQFQGAISDFHPIREFIKAADYDPLLIRVNEDDLYGDGNNYEVGAAAAAAAGAHPAAGVAGGVAMSAWVLSSSANTSISSSSCVLTSRVVCRGHAAP